jgi:hypothetical protein
MNKNTFVKRAVVAGGFLFLCAVPRLSLGQAIPAGAVRPTRTRPASAQPRNAVPPPDLLAGLTLTDDQTAKIDQIRAETKSRLAAVTDDDKLRPDVKDAMLGGFQRIENAKIFDVLTPEQQRDVRKRISAWKAEVQKNQRPSPQALAPAKDSQPK